ncbi:AfsR/SARP family transcriptional regulator [Allokutzneria sp. A3M-2-11 16]|uniref:AfsR/SARP family transcriptional regulator n=1 Tax=Allokutzneria sp. A3M-2-11 16 TaxID=2962043 RepID=UPI0035A866F3
MSPPPAARPRRLRRSERPLRRARPAPGRGRRGRSSDPFGKQRVLLAALLLRANRVVPTGELIGFLWAENPPANATRTVHTYVTRLRKSLGDRDLIGAVPDGFLIRLPSGALDVEDFERLARQGLHEAAQGNRDAARTPKPSACGAATCWRTCRRSPCWTVRMARIRRAHSLAEPVVPRGQGAAARPARRRQDGRRRWCTSNDLWCCGARSARTSEK